MKEEQIQSILTGNDCEGTQAERELAQSLVENGDGGLASEIRSQREFDDEVRRSFAAIPVPESLRDAILRDRFQMGSPAPHDRVDARDRSLHSELPSAIGPTGARKNRTWLYAAAAAVVALMLVRIPAGEPADEVQSVAVASSARASVGDFVTSIANHFPKIGAYDYLSSDFASIESYLTQYESPVHWRLKNNGAAAQPEPVGCRVLDIDGVRLSMICMQGEMFMHLFIAPASSCGGAEFDGLMDFEEGDRSFVAWRDGEHLYVVAARGPREPLRSQVQSSFAMAR